MCAETPTVAAEGDFSCFKFRVDSVFVCVVASILGLPWSAVVMEIGCTALEEH